MGLFHNPVAGKSVAAWQAESFVSSVPRSHPWEFIIRNPVCCHIIAGSGFPVPPTVAD
jgi:hypothetical protein